ncbi:PleD family two-component system response regulator [Adhaeretor mobilis]|nr:hypothetical protein [Adhaeretor mobilis]
MASTRLLTLFVASLLGGATFATEIPGVDFVPVELTLDASQNPAVAAVLEQDRDTPAEKLRVVMTLLDLGYPGTAEPILNELSKANLDAKTLIELSDRFGSARLVRIVRQSREPALRATPAFRTAAAELVQNILDAAAERARDPQRLAKLIEQLSDKSEVIQREARSDLSVGGEPALTACFNALGATEEEDLRAQLLTTLALMRPAVEAPTLAVLAEGEGLVQRDAAELAGHLRIDAALPYLALLSVRGDNPPASQAARNALLKWSLPLPSSDEAFELARRDLTAMRKSPPTVLDSPQADPLSGGSPWWNWDSQTKQLTKTELAARPLRIRSAARLARALTWGGMPVAGDLRETLLLLSWEEAGVTGERLSDDLKPWIESLSVDELNSMLAEAIKREYYAGAVICIEMLGERGDTNALVTGTHQPTALAAALASPQRAVRFAALQAVMKLAPGRRFPGSSHVAPTLWYFATSAGDPVALAGGSTVAHANEWAGSLRGLGYDATPAVNGRGLLLAAFDRSRSSRLAIVLLDANLDRPNMRETLYQLRSNPALRNVPVAVLSPGDRLREMEPLARAHSNLLVEPRLTGAEAMERLVQRLQTASGPQLPSAEVRMAQAKYALETVTKLLLEGHAYDELIRDSAVVSGTLYDPALTEASLDVLTNLGTQMSQLALADYASSRTQTVQQRRAAQAGFAESVDHFGLQLTRTQLLRQYDRYNESEGSDAESQAVLSGLLDVIESRARRRKRVEPSNSVQAESIPAGSATKP